MLRAARWKYRTQKSRQKSLSRHHRTTLSGHIFATKACIDNRKKTCFVMSCDCQLIIKENDDDDDDDDDVRNKELRKQN